MGCGGRLSNAHTHKHADTHTHTQTHTHTHTHTHEHIQIQRGKGEQGEGTSQNKYLRTCTSILRPSTTVPCNFSLALSASTLYSNVTNPKPYMQDGKRQEHSHYFHFFTYYTQHCNIFSSMLYVNSNVFYINQYPKYFTGLSRKIHWYCCYEPCAWVKKGNSTNVTNDF